MGEFKKSDAIDLAHAVRMTVDAFVLEGFDEAWAIDFVFNLLTAKR